MSDRAPIRVLRRTPRPRIEQLLPLACLASAAVLFAAELMTTFEFTPPGGEPLAEQTGGDRHGYALAVIAAFAFAATLVAVLAASKPAAVGVGISGGIALVVFLVVDLPDVGAVGTLEDARQAFFDAEAVPREGFWLGLLGAVGLAVSGTALATLSPDQLAALAPRRGSGEAVTGEAPREDGPDRTAAEDGPDRTAAEDGRGAGGPPGSREGPAQRPAAPEESGSPGGNSDSSRTPDSPRLKGTRPRDERERDQRLGRYQR